MKKELRKLTRALHRYLLNAGLVLEFHLPDKVLQIVVNWIESHENTTYCPLEGDEFICFLIPKKEVDKLKRSIREINP